MPSWSVTTASIGFAGQYKFLEIEMNVGYNSHALLNGQRRKQMKKVILALFAVMTLAACTGSYKSGNCEYDFLLHKDISISKIIGSCN